MSNDVTLTELDAELLPERQTMFAVLIGNVLVGASNASETVQTLTFASAALSSATQNIVIL
jgi:hypothetical protein